MRMHGRETKLKQTVHKGDERLEKDNKEALKCRHTSIHLSNSSGRILKSRPKFLSSVFSFCLQSLLHVGLSVQFLEALTLEIV